MFRLIHQTPIEDTLDPNIYASEGSADEAAKAAMEADHSISVIVLRPIATFKARRAVERVPYTLADNGAT